MNKDAFDQLARSVRQAGKIRRGEMRASRATEYRAADVKAVRHRLNKSQSDFALMNPSRSGSSFAEGRRHES